MYLSNRLLEGGRLEVLKLLINKDVYIHTNDNTALVWDIRKEQLRR